MSRFCVKCDRNPAKYNYSGSKSALYCDGCASMFMVVIIKGECVVIGCHELATHGWSEAITCKLHSNKKMIIVNLG